MKKKDRDFEKLVAAISDSLSGNSNTTVLHNQILTDVDGINRQIDVLIETSDSQTVTERIAVECKNWNENVKLEQVDAFLFKIGKLNIPKGIVVSKKGFQSGAITRANNNSNVELRILSEIDKKTVKQWFEQGPFRIVRLKMSDNYTFDLLFFQPPPKFSFEDLEKSIIDGNAVKKPIPFSRFALETRIIAFQENKKRLMDEGNSKFDKTVESANVNCKFGKRFNNGDFILKNKLGEFEICGIEINAIIEYNFETSGKLNPKALRKLDDTKNEARVLSAKFKDANVVFVEPEKHKEVKAYFIPSDPKKERIEMENIGIPNLEEE
ncbi:MAG: restriction endonuclease [Bacteroidia bacterium]|nr:restriction endonuclease [Bacteroidia bacterium]